MKNIKIFKKQKWKQQEEDEVKKNSPKREPKKSKNCTIVPCVCNVQHMLCVWSHE